MTNERRNQGIRILEFIDRYGSINQMQALNYLAVMRLAARISDLEKAGHQFKHELTKGKNRYGETITYMTYKKVA